MVVDEHTQAKNIHLAVKYPKHEDRRESDLYEKNRSKLVDEMGLGCAVCGTREDLETHHWVEWAEWNAIDPKKPVMLIGTVYPDVYGFKRKMDPKVMDSPDVIWNLVVLCEQHHRGAPNDGEEGGIHNMTYPEWVAQAVAQDGYLVVQETED